jgi:hypothetical protein
MSLRDVCALAESADPPIWSFHCLDCGSQLRVRDRDHRVRLQRSLEAFCKGDADDHLADLLCETHFKQREEHAEEQRRFDLARQQALLRDYRKLSYELRRETEEWAITKSWCTAGTTTAAVCATVAIFRRMYITGPIEGMSKKN